VLYALSAGQKTGLGLVAAAFVAFALLSAFVIPKYRPDYPGRGLRLFIGVTVLFTIGMLSAVIALGSEPKEKTAESAPAATSAPAPAPQPQPQPEQPPPPPPAASTAAPPAPPPPSPAPAGDAAAGKALFASNGCGSCHTFTPANATGKVGPDLDHLAADAQKANQGSLADYTKESIHDPNAYVVPGFPKGVMPSFSSLSDQQLADLVAFLTQGQ
jgi:mono/diheme cytochrome c family protein